MFFSKSSLLAIATSATLGFAQTSATMDMSMAASSTMAMDSTATMASAAPSGSVLVHVINAKAVNGKPVFDPPQVMANVGDLVQFHFWPMNHSVVQATFADPCLPISESASGNGTQGFFSGFMPVSASSTEMPTFTIEVNSTKPIWFYCSQAKHCQNGMVGVINPTAAKNLTDFMARAALATSNVTPGMTSGGDNTVPTVTNGTSVSQTGASTMSTVMATGTAATNGSKPGAPAGTNAAPGSAAYLSSSIAVIVAAVAASMLLV